MVIIKADRNTEAGVMPSEDLLREMGNYNEELVKAGVMLDGNGLHPSSKGARILFKGKERRVVDGPFAETKELIAGYWLWQVKSREEAIEWARRCPNPTGEESVIELRQVFEAEDFGAEFTPELRAQEERLMAEAAALKAAAQAPATTAAVNPVPPSDGATPYLVVQGAHDAIAWYQRVFGAELVAKIDAPDGKVMHSELKVGPARFMLTEENLAYGSRGPKTIGGSSTTTIVFVPDVDATVKAAVAAGATAGMPVADQFWGDRSGTITDPFGHQWFVSTHKEDLTRAQIEARVKALFASGAGC
jgi:uncharacterized glyoxalase superfamily protein PhnB